MPIFSSSPEPRRMSPMTPGVCMKIICFHVFYDCLQVRGSRFPSFTVATPGAGEISDAFTVNTHLVRDVDNSAINCSDSHVDRIGAPAPGLRARVFRTQDRLWPILDLERLTRIRRTDARLAIPVGQNERWERRSIKKQ